MKIKKLLVSFLVCGVIFIAQAYSGASVLPGSPYIYRNLGVTDLTGQLDTSKLVGYGDKLLESEESSAGIKSYAADDIVDVIVQLSAEPVIDKYIQRDTGFAELTDYYLSSEGKNASRNLDIMQERVIKNIRSQGIDMELGHSYNLILNGFSAKVRYGDLGAISATESVDRVEISSFFTAGDGMTEEGLDALIEKAAEDNVSEVALSNNGIFDSSEAGNLGEGMLISIIDSGTLLGHQAFSVAPSAETLKYSDSSYITSGMLSALQAYKDNISISASSLFQSAKIPFAYDYADRDTNANPGSSSHGTHVAGIAAGNNGGNFLGAAPQAQIAVMKVFGNNVSGAYDADVFAAIEDSVIIRSDAINISLGSDAGFTKDTENDPGFEDVFAKVHAAGIGLYVAAGNAATSYDKSRVGNAGKTSTPDNGIVGAPATFSSAIAVASSTKSGGVSSFSSWGPLNDLSLKPEITAPGTDIRSSVANSASTYERSSGTSMATPNITGISTVLKNHLKQKYPELNAYDLNILTDRVMMNTASILYNDDVTYSPRKQGAGVANILDAIRTDAYLYVDGQDRAKLELGDDKERTGIYNLTFNIKNTANEPQSYAYDIITNTETVSMYAGTAVMAQKSYVLNPSKRIASIDGGTESGGVITIEAGGLCTVNFEVTLSARDKTYLEDNFKNGMYVEGYVRLLSMTTKKSDLSIPWLGFYGDWADQSSFDVAAWSNETAAIEQTKISGQYKQNGVTRSAELGKYSFVSTESVPADAGKIALGPQDSNIFNILKMDTALLRNVWSVKTQVVDTDTGEALTPENEITGQTVKSYYVYSYVSGSFTKYSTGSSPLFSMSDYNLNNNSRYALRIIPYIDFGEAPGSSLDIAFTADFEAPKVTEAVASGGNLNFKLFDNHYTQAVQLYFKFSGLYYDLTDYFTPGNQTGIGQTKDYSFELDSAMIRNINQSDDGKIYIYAIDYARNESWYGVDYAAAPQKSAGAAAFVPAVYPEQKPNVSAASYTRANTFVESGVTYRNVPNGYELVSYPADKSGENYTVKPGTVRVADRAFKNNAYLSSVYLPASLKRIGADAFMGCTSLAEYKFGSEEAPLLESVYAAGSPPSYSNFSASGAADGTAYTSPNASGYDSYIWQGLFGNFDIHMSDEMFIFSYNKIMSDPKTERRQEIVTLLDAYKRLGSGSSGLEIYVRELKDVLCEIDIAILNEDFISRMQGIAGV